MNITNIKNRLLIKYPNFGSIIASCKFIEEFSIPTACTDGKDVYYNPNYMDNLNEDEQLFIIAHEVCHIAFKHIPRSEGKIPYLWNISTDGVINQYLKRDGLPIVKGGVDMPSAINFDAESLYKLLVKEKEEKEMKELYDNLYHSAHLENGVESLDDSDDDRSYDVGHDTHSMWSKEIEKSKENSNVNNDSNEIISESEVFNENQKEREKLLKKLRQDLVKSPVSSSHTKNNRLKNKDNIGYSEPILKWETILRDSINLDGDWSYDDATFEDGVLTPHFEERPYPETEILLDTSGSIDEELLKDFLRECKNIFQSSKVKVGCFDEEFYGFQDVKSIEDIEKLSFEGGGGTDFEVAVNAFSKRAENKIVFTDGESESPGTYMPAIWIVFGHKSTVTNIYGFDPPGGTVIFVNEKDIRKKGRSR